MVDSGSARRASERDDRLLDQQIKLEYDRDKQCATTYQRRNRGVGTPWHTP